MKLLALRNYMIDFDPGWVIDTLHTRASVEAYFTFDAKIDPWIIRRVR